MLSVRPFGLSTADLLGVASVVIAFWFAVPQLRGCAEPAAPPA